MGDIVLQVSEAIDIINSIYQEALPFIIIEGEVASFKVNQGKFVFFDIKDTEGSLGCFMMVFQLKFPIEDGMKVKIVAQPKLTKWGKFSLTVKEVTPIGAGSLKKSFELLKAKLQAEGLFDSGRKRELPGIPSRVAVISSSQAAGYADFIKILENRWGGLSITLYDIAVQGVQAPRDVIGALGAVNEVEQPYDVVAIIRGGGSADDLSTFNHEDVVRAVAASRTPTLLGVGHEIDTSLCDFAADVRASTPSNAAEILVPDKLSLLAENDRSMNYIDRAQSDIFLTRCDQITSMKEEVHSLASEYVWQKIETVQSLQRTMNQLNPERVLRRGYAVVRHDDTVITAAKHATIGSAITIEFTDGKIGATVENVE